MTRLTTDLDRILTSQPVNRVAVRVTLQPHQGEIAPVRENVPAPISDRSVTVTYSQPSRRFVLKQRIKELERALAVRGTPKPRRRELAAEKHACEVELCRLRLE